MKTAPSEPPVDLADRLGSAYVALRPDLEVHRHLYHGVPSYVIRDPLTLQCHQVTTTEYQIMVHLSTDHSLSETFESLVSAKQLEPENEEEFYKFILQLHQYAFLNLPISNDKSLYRRHIAKQNAKRKERLMAFLFLRIPLLNPDSFLNKTAHIARPFFTQWFFFIWIAMIAVSGIVVINKRNELFIPIADMFTASNMICMWIVLVLLKVFHEFGHAYACKLRGGYVSEMGLYLIAFNPCAYVDVTSSWGFSKKLDRVVVGLGGVYVELMIAMVALFVWLWTDTSPVHTIAHNVFFLAGATTLLININPLMRFDGYYILSDLLEVPNLRRQSQQFVIQVIKRVFVGIELPQQRYGKIMLTVMFVFGVASSLYKAMVVVSISVLLATKYFLMGMLLAAFYGGFTLINTLKRITVYLWKSPEAAPVRVRAIMLSVLLLIGVPLIVFCLPVPASVSIPGQLLREYEYVDYAQHDGFIQDVSAASGEMVTPGTQLATLQNIEIKEGLYEAQTHLLKAQKELCVYKARSVNSTDVAKQQEIIKVLKSRLKYHQEELDKLNVYAGASGMVITQLDENSLGCFVKRGEPLANIVSGRWVAKVFLTEKDIARAQPYPGQETQLRLTACPESVIRGIVTRISPARLSRLDNPTLTNLGQGDVVIDHATNEVLEPYYETSILIEDPQGCGLQYGMTCQATLSAAATPIGTLLVQKILRFVNNLNRV